MHIRLLNCCQIRSALIANQKRIFQLPAFLAFDYLAVESIKTFLLPASLLNDFMRYKMMGPVRLLWTVINWREGRDGAFFWSNRWLDTRPSRQKNSAKLLRLAICAEYAKMFVVDQVAAAYERLWLRQISAGAILFSLFHGFLSTAN